MQDVRDTPLPCLKCGRELDSVSRDHMPTQPYDATVFVAHGQYGSTVFDPSPGSRLFLEVNICDPCLREAAELGREVRGNTPPPRPQDTVYKQWTAPSRGDDE